MTACRNAGVAIIVAAMAVLFTDPARAGQIVSMIGTDDGFAGTQGAHSHPGDPYFVGRLPFIQPGTYVNAAGMDVETAAPNFYPYIFIYHFALDTTGLASVSSASLFVQTGSVSLENQPQDTETRGFGHARVIVGNTDIGQFWQTDTGERTSALEESVKGHTFDITPFVTAGTNTTLTVTLDGTNPLAISDQIAIDFARVTVNGSLATPEPGSLTLLGLGLASFGGMAWMKKRKTKLVAA